MKELAGSHDGVYSMKQMKRKLELRYAGDIIGGGKGRPNLICFKDAAKFIIKQSMGEKEKRNLSES